MNEFSKKNFESFDDFNKKLQTFCDNTFNVLRVQDCKKKPRLMFRQNSLITT